MALLVLHPVYMSMAVLHAFLFVLAKNLQTRTEAESEIEVKGPPQRVALTPLTSREAIKSHDVKGQKTACSGGLTHDVSYVCTYVQFGAKS